MDSILSFVLFLLALSLLICLHELGHFSMAKLFKVYCHEFSIGFGPALIHKKGKGKETYFSLRALPLGGYVSMYGEEDSIPKEENVILTPDRSIEGIAKWKKAIIVSAGIIVNALLALVIFGVRNLCFPYIAATKSLSVKEDSIAMVAGIENDDSIVYFNSSENVNYAFSYEFTDDEGIINAGSFYIVDYNVIMNSKNYVLTFDYYTSKQDNNFSAGAALYPTISKADVLDESNPNHEIYFSLYGEWINELASLEATATPEEISKFPNYFPDVVLGAYQINDTTVFDANITILRNEEQLIKPIHFVGTSEGLQDIGLNVKIKEYYLPFEQSVKNIFVDFKDSALLVFKGLGTLFSRGGIKNMSGLVGIFTASKSLLTTQSFSTYLYFWGLISVNLAIFNLLPFPGLDGWQLLVTAIEGITKKKLPTKFKTIMSLIGFVLLIGLMVVVLVFDIIRLI